MNLPNAAVLGEVDLPPTLRLPEFPDSLAQANADSGCHPFRIEVILAAYLSHTISAMRARGTLMLKRVRHVLVATAIVCMAGAVSAQSLAELKKQAAVGNAGAQFNLGRLYFLGQGVPKDTVEAARWYRKAAEQGEIDAQYMLGVAYSYGTGVPQSYAQAALWYRKAADRGDEEAQDDLGELYLNGGVLKEEDGPAGKSRPFVRDNGGGDFPKDYSVAAMWLRKSAEQGNSDAQNDLGLLYEEGNGVPQDLAEAYFWYSLAAAKVLFYSGNREHAASNLPRALLLRTQERARKWSEDHTAK